MDRSGDSEKVVHPKHYNSHPSGIEAWDVCEQLGFNVGNAVKYLFRAGLKEGESQDVDLKKARAYLARAAKKPRKTQARFEHEFIEMVENVEMKDPESVLSIVLSAWLDSPCCEDETAQACLKAFDGATNRRYVP